MAPAPRDVAALVFAALEEDLGSVGDLSSTATIPAEARGQAVLVARADGVISGTDFVRETYAQVDPDVEVILTPADWESDDDIQLDTAIAIALKTLDEKPASVAPEFLPPRF